MSTQMSSAIQKLFTYLMSTEPVWYYCTTFNFCFLSASAALLWHWHRTNAGTFRFREKVRYEL